MSAGTGALASPHEVLVVGDANVDLVLRGDVVPRFGQAEQLLDAADLVLGGSAAIVACGLARLGVPVRLAAVVGDDVFGEFVLGALRGAGVDTRDVRVATGVATGVSVILSGADRAILTHLGALPLLDAADVRLADARWLHLASPFLLEPFTRQAPGVLEAARSAGVGTSLDPNWDPAERWRALAPLLPHLDVLLPNRAERDALAAALPELESGPRVVLKDGASGGASFAGAERIAAAPGLVVDVVDTTGAGDTFDAGYLSALAYGVGEEAQRLRWAAVAGSLSTRGAGGTAAQPTRAELLAAV